MRPKTLKIQVALRQYLEKIGVSAYTLGKWVQGISPQTIYAIANGSRKPSLEALEAILNALHEQGFMVSLEDLIRVETSQPTQGT